MDAEQAAGLFGRLTSSLRAVLAAPGVGNTAWLFGDRLLRMGVGLLVGVWVARYLGPEQYGLLSFAGSYVMLFSALALFGLESLVVRELVARPEARGAILGSACAIRLAAGACAYLLALAILPFSRPGDTQALLMVALLGGSLLFQALEVSDLWFQSRVASRFSVIARSSAFLFSSLVKLIMVLRGASLLAITWATAVEALLAACFLTLAYRVSGEQLSGWRFSGEWLKRLWRESLPMVLSGIVLMVYLRIDQVMLGILASKSELGLYAAAVRISELWYFVPAAIVSSLFPGLVRLQSSDPEAYRQRLQNLYNLLALLGYLVALPVTLLAPWLVELLFGAAYRAAAPLLMVLVWAGLFANLSVARNAHFIAQGWGKAMLWNTLAGAVVNVALNCLLIPSYGALGSAIATCLSYWVAAHGACYLNTTLRPTAHMMLRSLMYPRWW